MKQRVLIDALRPIRLAVAAHVRSDHAETCFCECRKLMPPRIPGFGKAMAQNNQRPRAALRNVHADTVRVDVAVSDIRHAVSISGGGGRFRRGGGAFSAFL